MFLVSRTFDEALIYDCIVASWKHVSDDGSPRADLYFPDIGQHNYWLTVHLHGEFLGIFLASPHGTACKEVHAALLPNARGYAVGAAKQAIKWMFNNTECARLIAWIPAYNRLAVNMARKSGMTVCGVNNKSFLKDGALHDEVLLGISKGESCQ